MSVAFTQLCLTGNMNQGRNALIVKMGVVSGCVYTWLAIFINGYFTLTVFKNNIVAHLSAFRKVFVYTNPCIQFSSVALVLFSHHY